MKFIPDYEVEAFAALQNYVREGLQKTINNLTQVFVQVVPTDAETTMGFTAGSRWVGVGFYRTPRTTVGKSEMSWFSVVSRGIEEVKDPTPDGTSESKYFHFTTDFLPSGVAQAGDEVIRLLTSR